MEKVSLSQGCGEVLGWLGRGNLRVARAGSRHRWGDPGFVPRREGEDLGSRSSSHSGTLRRLEFTL